MATVVQLPTSVLNHVVLAAESPVPDSVRHGEPVWKNGRKTFNSTVTADEAALAWMEQELSFLVWRFANTRSLAAQVGIAPAQAERSLAAVRGLRAA